MKETIDYKTCDHQFCRFTGKMPCTGIYKCQKCGSALDFPHKKNILMTPDEVIETDIKAGKTPDRTFTG